MDQIQIEGESYVLRGKLRLTCRTGETIETQPGDHVAGLAYRTVAWGKLGDQRGRDAVERWRLDFAGNASVPARWVRTE